MNVIGMSNDVERCYKLMDSPKHVRGDLTGPPRLSGGSLGSRTPSSQQELQAVFVPLPMEAERDMEGHGGHLGTPPN